MVLRSRICTFLPSMSLFMFIVNGKDFENSVLFDQNPPYSPLQDLRFSSSLHYLPDFITGLHFYGIIIDFYLPILEVTVECLGFIEEVAVYLPDPWQPISLILDGVRRKKPKKPINVLSCISFDIAVKKLPYLLLCRDEA